MTSGPHCQTALAPPIPHQKHVGQGSELRFVFYAEPFRECCLHFAFTLPSHCLLFILIYSIAISSFLHFNHKSASFDPWTPLLHLFRNPPTIWPHYFLAISFHPFLKPPKLPCCCATPHASSRSSSTCASQTRDIEGDAFIALVGLNYSSGLKA